MCDRIPGYLANYTCLCRMRVGCRLEVIGDFYLFVLVFRKFIKRQNKTQQQEKKNQKIKMKLAIGRFGRFTNWQGCLVCLFFFYSEFSKMTSISTASGY